MRSRLFRAFVTLAALAVVWFVASPAWAAKALVSLHPPAQSVPVSSWAPLCDPRGATVLAPPPQLQDAETSLDTGLTLEDCMRRDGTAARDIAPGRTPVSPDASTSTDAAIVSSLPAPLGASFKLLRMPRVSRSRMPGGVRLSLDRPPRP